MKNGFGVLYSNDINNSHIIGKFKNNKIDGKVVLKFNDFEENILLFKNNKFCNIVEDVNELHNFRISNEYRNLITFYEKIKTK
jgi:hypothetical protein